MAYGWLDESDTVSEETKTYIGQGSDAGTCVWCHSNETKITVWRKQVNFANYLGYGSTGHLKDQWVW